MLKLDPKAIRDGDEVLAYVDGQLVEGKVVLVFYNGRVGITYLNSRKERLFKAVDEVYAKPRYGTTRGI